jgi:hypothetical protein
MNRLGRTAILVVGLLTVGLALLAPAPAAAHVVEVTTSLALEPDQDQAKLKEALRTEVDRVLSTTIAFKPTLVALTDARRVGERLMVRLLIADEEGEKLIREFGRGGDGAEPDPDEPTKAGTVRL